MISILKELIHNNISLDLSIEVIITFAIALILIFLGINDDVKTKTYQKKNFLMMYLILFITTFYFESTFWGILIFLIIWYLSGIALLQNKEITLEKELGVGGLFFYITSYWMFLSKSYLLIVCLFTIYIYRILIKSFHNVLPENLYSYILIIIITVFFIIHFIKNTQDYFDIERWDLVQEKIQNSLNRSINNPDAVDNIVENHDEINIRFLSFLLYMEDRYLLDRKSNTYGFYNIKKALKSNIVLLFRRRSHNQLKVNDKWINKFRRGFSTIEQQVSRKVFMKDYSYQYKIRRKLFVERALNRSFIDAWSTRKAKEYKKIDRKNAKLLLKKSLKYNYLKFYYLNILGNPCNKNELFAKMHKESRVTISLYEKIYEGFEDSEVMSNLVTKLEEAKQNELKYGIFLKSNHY